MWTKIRLKTRSDGPKSIEFENTGQLRYLTQGALVVEAEKGKETLFPWTNVAYIETSGITQDDVREIRAMLPGEDEVEIDRPPMEDSGEQLTLDHVEEVTVGDPQEGPEPEPESGLD